MISQTIQWRAGQCLKLCDLTLTIFLKAGGVKREPRRRHPLACARDRKYFNAGHGTTLLEAHLEWEQLHVVEVTSLLFEST
jgi:hypothetical protein